MKTANNIDKTPPTQSWASVLVEIVLIVGLYFLFAGYEPPGVNESHYLCKAKHYWNPEWCAGDRFLQSADAHAVFYWTFGWVTQFASLTTTAWIGRFITWWLLAWSWQRLSFAVVPRAFFSILSAGLFLLFIKQYSMAGEWVVGGVEAKGFAYVFVFLGLEAIARNRWQWVFPLFGAAAAFHVIIGGWAVLIGFGVWSLLQLTKPKDESLPSILQLLPALMFGFTLSLPGLLPCLLLNRGASPEVIAEGNRIYVYERLGHHLLLHRFNSYFILRHAVLMLGLCGLTGIVTQVRPLWRVAIFAWGCVLLVICGAMIDLIFMEAAREQSAAILRFYWYRMSDAIVPVGVSLALTWWIAIGIQGIQWRRVAFSLAVIASVLNLGNELWLRISLRVSESEVSSAVSELKKTKGEFDPHKFNAEWRACCDWIRENTDATDIVITSKGLPSTFLWYAERAEVASWKNAPQDARGLVDWMRRIENLNIDREFIYEPSIDKSLPPAERWKLMGTQYGAKYLVGKIKKGTPPLPFTRVYPNAEHANETFAVYLLPDANADIEEMNIGEFEELKDDKR